MLARPALGIFMYSKVGCPRACPLQRGPRKRTVKQNAVNSLRELGGGGKILVKFF